MGDLIYGLHPVREALKASRRKPLELFYQSKGHAPRLEEVLALARQQGVPLRPRQPRDLEALVGAQVSHQGVVLRLEPFAYVPLEDLLERWRHSERPAFLLVLDGITDPHNFGAILRSADAAGCHGVIVPKDRFCAVTPVVDKVSAGALEHLPLAQVTNLARALEDLKGAGIWVYGLADAGSSGLYGTDLSGDLALVVGSEGKGIRPNVQRHCDALLSIPMRGGVSSLNASVATAVALFEAVRQRQGEP